jgi:hypothetical protein
MIVGISTSNEADAVALLATGFPAVRAETWQERLARIRLHADNETIGIPPGFLMMSGNSFSGVVLTPCALRPSGDDASNVTLNLSSWYVSPAQRWRALPMLRQVMRLPAARVTELTPTPGVEAMMPALGLVPMNAGETFIFLPCIAGTRFKGASVADHDEAGASIEPWLRSLVARHRDVGCLAATIDTQAGPVTLLMKRRIRKRMPTLQLIYCDSNAALLENLGSVARYLTAKGHLVLVMDIPLEASSQLQPPGIHRPLHGRKYATSPLPHNTTDHAGSELALFDA